VYNSVIGLNTLQIYKLNIAGGECGGWLGDYCVHEDHSTLVLNQNLYRLNIYIVWFVGHCWILCQIC